MTIIAVACGRHLGGAALDRIHQEWEMHLPLITNGLVVETRITPVLITQRQRSIVSNNKAGHKSRVVSGAAIIAAVLDRWRGLSNCGKTLGLCMVLLWESMFRQD